MQSHVENAILDRNTFAQWVASISRRMKLLQDCWTVSRELEAGIIEDTEVLRAKINSLGNDYR